MLFTPFVASADAPPAPLLSSVAPQLSSSKGIWIDEVQQGRGKWVLALYGGNLYLSRARIDVSPAQHDLVVEGTHEAVGSAAYHDEIAVYLHFGVHTQGTNDVYYRDLSLYGPPPSVNISDSPGEEFEPSIYNGIVAWRGQNGVFMLDIFNQTTPTLLGAGAQPDVGSSVIAFTDSGKLHLYDLQTSQIDSFGSVGDISWPSVGGNIVAYSVDTPAATHSVRFFDLQNPDGEMELGGPCSNHQAPRVSRDGRIILHVGTQCPSGKDGLFVSVISDPANPQTYKLADFNHSTDRLRDMYSITFTAVGYLEQNGSIRFVELDL